MASEWKNFKNIFLPYVLDLVDLLAKKFPRFQFEGKTDV